MGVATITCRPNGPYVVEGEIALVDPTGAEVDVKGATRVFLCRCGGSSTKPFCDGTHKRSGFSAAGPAAQPHK